MPDWLIAPLIDKPLLMTAFIDRTVLHLSAGNGGHGCASVHREKYKPMGGPDGGNGGRGGDIILEVDPGVHTLLDFHHRPHHRAGNGKPGQGDHRNGAQGEDRILAVPEGTVVSGDDGEILIDLVGEGTRYVVAQGGRGGLGNAALASARRKAPGFALLGEAGKSRDVVLELKSVADVGLVGFPSAGKSSLIAAVSAAKPKIADYPFTTLAPNLGVVAAGEHTFTMADVPGLIPGAARGKGLGLEFLRHVERCSVLVHVVDAATLEPGRDPFSDIEAIESELAAYGGAGGALVSRLRAVAVNKIDVTEARELADLVVADLADRGYRVFLISAVTGEGVGALTYYLAEQVAADRASRPAPAPTRLIIRPTPVDDTFSVTADRDVAGGFVVRGVKPERWIRQTDFSNDEAVGYLADRLARLGVEDALVKAGAVPGCLVTVADVSFDWVPSTPDASSAVVGRRGEDPRLDTSDRVTADERLARKKARRRRTDAGDYAADGSGEPTSTAAQAGIET